MGNVQFDTILPLNYNSIPFAADISTTLEKGLILLDPSTSKFTTTLETDERILLVIDTVRDEDDYSLIDTIIKRVKRYDAVIAGVIVIFDQDIGEFVRLTSKIPVYYSVFSFNEICELGYNNHLICQFEYEKYKFYSEKMIKQELIKLDVDIDSARNENILDVE
jgi:orotate phosphoribosyltransferase